MLSGTKIFVHPSRVAEFEAWRATLEPAEKLMLCTRPVGDGYAIIVIQNDERYAPAWKFREPLN